MCLLFICSHCLSQEGILVWEKHDYVKSVIDLDGKIIFQKGGYLQETSVNTYTGNYVYSVLPIRENQGLLV